MSINNQTSEKQLPNSKRTYVVGKTASVRVPFREISLNVTKSMNGAVEVNEPIRVYDVSGPWGDPTFKGDVRDGLPGLRSDWIIGRGDVEEYEGRKIEPRDNGYLTVGAEGYARNKDKGKLEDFPGLKRQPLKAKAGDRKSVV